MIPTGLRVHLRAGLECTEVPARNVIGYLPGADITTAGERILVVAPYGVPSAEGGASHTWADENASGVAVMLEIGRLWRDLAFDPKPTVVFAAFDMGGGVHFMNHPAIPIRFSDPWTVVVVGGLGAGEASLARTELGAGLAPAFDQSARRFGVLTQRLEEWEIFCCDASSRSGAMRPGTSYSGVAVIRLGDALEGPPATTWATWSHSCCWRPAGRWPTISWF